MDDQAKTAMEEKGLTIVRFRNSLQFEGKNYEALSMDLESLTGKDVIDAENEARALGVRAVMLESSKEYQAIIAAKAAHVTVDLIKALPAKEFSSVTGEVQGFLLG